MAVTPAQVSAAFALVAEETSVAAANLRLGTELAPLFNAGGGGGGAVEQVVASLPLVVTPATGIGVVTVSHASSGVVAATYGDATHYPVVVVDAFGHVTSVSVLPTPVVPAASSAPALALGVAAAGAATTWSRADHVHPMPTAAQVGAEPTIAAGTTAQYRRGDKTWQTLNTTVVPEGTNLYYTDARARWALTYAEPIFYNPATGVIAHYATDGNLHVPATSTTNNGRFLKAGATAGAISWAALSTADVSGLTGWATKAFTNGSTTDVAEGTRLYYTDARARAAISGTSPISYNSSTGVISHLATDGNLHVPATGTGNNGRFLKSGATAGAISWASLVYADLTGTVPTWNQNTTGSAAKWTTPRTLTIGATGKTIDGTGNQSWSLAEIGAAPAHSFGANVVLKSNGSGGFAASTASDNGTLFATTGRLGWDGGTLRDLVGDSGKTALYGVLVPETASNYGLAVSKNGSEAWLNGSYASVLAASGAVVALATSSGLAISGALSVSGATTLASSLNGLLKATSGVVSAASSADLPGGPYLPLAAGAGSPLTSDLYFTDTGTGSTLRGIRGTVGNNDFWRVVGGNAAGGVANNGYMEIATADDGNEPIYVRQYTGAFVTATRTLTLLDGSGNSSFPGSITAGLAQMSSWAPIPSDFGRFGHQSWNTAAGFGYIQHSNGEVLLEAPTGRSIHLRINGPDVVLVNSSGAQVTGTLSVSGLSTLAGATITSANRLTITGGESSNIRTVYNNTSAITINSPVTNASIRHAWSHAWYATDWQTGNIRGGSTDSAGYGITVDNNNLRWRVTNGTTYDYNALVVSGTLDWGGGGAIGSSANVVQGANGTRTTTADLTVALPSGFYDNAGGSTPNGTWCHAIIGRHANGGNNYQSQLVTDFENDRMWFRRIHNGTANAWRELWHTGNISTTVIGSLTGITAGQVVVGNGANGLTSSSAFTYSTNKLQVGTSYIESYYVGGADQYASFANTNASASSWPSALRHRFNGDIHLGSNGSGGVIRLVNSTNSIELNGPTRPYSQTHNTTSNFTLPVLAIGELRVMYFSASACSVFANSSQSVTYRHFEFGDIRTANPNARVDVVDAFGTGSSYAVHTCLLICRDAYSVTLMI